MSVTLTSGDIFGLPGAALVNPVNCFGRPGKGLALEFKNRFPRSTQAYITAGTAGRIKPGNVYIDERCLYGEPVIIYFPTKRHWRDKSRISDIDAALKAFVDILRRKPITPIAIPALGCGEGGLDWPDVRDMILQHMNDINGVDVYLFRPVPTPALHDHGAYRRRLV